MSGVARLAESCDMASDPCSKHARPHLVRSSWRLDVTLQHVDCLCAAARTPCTEGVTCQPTVEATAYLHIDRQDLEPVRIRVEQAEHGDLEGVLDAPKEHARCQIGLSFALVWTLRQRVSWLEWFKGKMLPGPSCVSGFLAGMALSAAHTPVAGF